MNKQAVEKGPVTIPGRAHAVYNRKLGYWYAAWLRLDCLEVAYVAAFDVRGAAIDVAEDAAYWRAHNPTASFTRAVFIVTR